MTLILRSNTFVLSCLVYLGLFFQSNQRQVPGIKSGQENRPPVRRNGGVNGGVNGGGNGGVNGGSNHETKTTRL